MQRRSGASLAAAEGAATDAATDAAAEAAGDEDPDEQPANARTATIPRPMPPLERHARLAG